MSRIIVADKDSKGRSRVHCPWVDFDLIVRIACRDCPEFEGDLGDPKVVVCSYSPANVALDDVHRDLTAPDDIEEGEDSK